MNNNIYLNCSYIPPELFVAADLNPVRLWPAEIEQHGQKLLPEDICPYIKALSAALAKKERIVLANSCDGMRRLYDILADRSFLLEVPKKSGTDEVKFYYNQLLNLLDYLEVDYNEEYSRKLLKVIGEYNKKRDLLNILRKKKPTSSFLEGIKIYTNNISGVLKEIVDNSKNIRSNENSPGVLISSSSLLDGQIIKLIEKNELQIKGIDSCLGERSFNVRVNLTKNDDPLKIIAESYLHKPGCPRNMEPDKRLEDLKKYVKTRNIRGIIYFIPKFCDQAAYDFKLIKDWSKEYDIPVLNLEGEYRTGQSGQLNTRIAAFRESLVI